MTVFVAATRVNWGDVPTWVSAAVSMLALVAAAAAAVQAFRLYLMERVNQDRAEAEATERAMDVRRSAVGACWWVRWTIGSGAARRESAQRL
jgi:hypothetical protein